MRALIANNAFHHLGQGPWRARFPRAESYAAPQALAKLGRKAASISFRSLDELSLPPTVKLHVLPGFKSWLFSWTDSAPGFRLFKLGVWFFVNDRRALKERMTVLLAEDPPALIVPGHGPAVTTANLAAEVRTQIAKL